MHQLDSVLAQPCRNGFGVLFAAGVVIRNNKDFVEALQKVPALRDPVEIRITATDRTGIEKAAFDRRRTVSLTTCDDKGLRGVDTVDVVQDRGVVKGFAVGIRQKLDLWDLILLLDVIGLADLDGDQHVVGIPILEERIPFQVLFDTKVVDGSRRDPTGLPVGIDLVLVVRIGGIGIIIVVGRYGTALRKIVIDTGQLKKLFAGFQKRAVFCGDQGADHIDGIAAAEAFGTMQLRIIGKAGGIILMIGIRAATNVTALIILFYLQQLRDQVSVAVAQLLFGLLDFFRIYKDKLAPFFYGLVFSIHKNSFMGRISFTTSTFCASFLV